MVWLLFYLPVVLFHHLVPVAKIAQHDFNGSVFLHFDKWVEITLGVNSDFCFYEFCRKTNYLFQTMWLCDICLLLNSVTAISDLLTILNYLSLESSFRKQYSNINLVINSTKTACSKSFW